jgi:hypothetical protein
VPHNTCCHTHDDVTRIKQHLKDSSSGCVSLACRVSQSVYHERSTHEVTCVMQGDVAGQRSAGKAQGVQESRTHVCAACATQI